MNNYQYRFDYLRLSTEEKPIPNVDGSTCYEVDTSKLFIAYKGQWYEQGATEEINSLNSETINISKNLKDNVKIIEEPNNIEYIEDYEVGEE